MLCTKCRFPTALINLYFSRNYGTICSMNLRASIFVLLLRKKFMHNAGIFSYYVRKTIFRNSKYQCDDRTRNDIAKAVIAHKRGLESVLLRTHIYRPLENRHSIQSSFVLVDLSRRYRTTTHSHMLSSFCLLSLL